jgi:hypothetical protein
VISSITTKAGASGEASIEPASNTVTTPGWRRPATVRISASTRRRSSPVTVSKRNSFTATRRCSTWSSAA